MSRRAPPPQTNGHHTGTGQPTTTTTTTSNPNTHSNDFQRTVGLPTNPVGPFGPSTGMLAPSDARAGWTQAAMRNAARRDLERLVRPLPAASASASSRSATDEEDAIAMNARQRDRERTMVHEQARSIPRVHWRNQTRSWDREQAPLTRVVWDYEGEESSEADWSVPPRRRQQQREASVSDWDSEGEEGGIGERRRYRSVADAEGRGGANGVNGVGGTNGDRRGAGWRWGAVRGS